MATRYAISAKIIICLHLCDNHASLTFNESLPSMVYTFTGRLKLHCSRFFLLTFYFIFSLYAFAIALGLQQNVMQNVILFRKTFWYA